MALVLPTKGARERGGKGSVYLLHVRGHLVPGGVKKALVVCFLPCDDDKKTGEVRTTQRKQHATMPALVVLAIVDASDL